MRQFGFQWHITNFCNLRCFHCYQSDFSHKDEVSYQIAAKIIHKISSELKDSQFTINVTGGEPFLYKGIFEVLRVLDATNNIRIINIITNGLFLNHEKIAKLNKLRKIRELKISLEGPDRETNDRIRGRGVFDRVMHNLKTIKYDSEKMVILMFTLGSYNLEHLSKMLQFARSHADGVIIERFVPWGRGRLLKDQYLKKTEWKKVIDIITQFAGINCEAIELLPYKAFHILFKKSLDLRGALCNLGEDSMALMPNGDVYPCRRFPTRIGNIISEDFSEILLRLKILNNSITENLKGKCASCGIEGCLGCRAIAYALTNDFYAEDPQCFL